MQMTHETAHKAAADWLKGEAAALPHLAPAINDVLGSPRSMDTLTSIVRNVASSKR
jgi:hypothetical protein